MKKQISILLCAVFLFAAVPMATLAQDEIFHPSDNVVFIGDSITHAGQYSVFIEHYYATRFPGSNIYFNNCGISGDSAAGALMRFDWDIISKAPNRATIMMGMNDINRYAYADGANVSQEAKDGYINTCLKNIEQLVQKLQAKGVSVTLISPSIYDQTVQSTAVNMVGCNDALGAVAKGVKALSQQYKCGFIDFYDNMNTINNALQAKNKASSILGSDRIHPAGMGHYLMTYFFLTQQGAPDVVSEAYFDTANADNNQYHSAEVDELLYNDENIIYTYTAKALPMAVTADYKAAQALVPLGDKLNREIIKASGLREGQYTIEMDGKKVLDTTAAQLLAGVNIAEIALSPNQVQAQSLFTLSNNKNALEQKLRIITFCEMYFIRAGINLYDSVAIDTFMKEKLPSMAAYNQGLFNQYKANKAAEAKIKEDIDGLRQKLSSQAVPVEHKVEIKLIGGTKVPQRQVVQLTDIEDSWAKDIISQSIAKGIVSGYPDNTFRPENNINVDEFIKLMLSAAKIKISPGTPYWAQPYIDKAIENGSIFPSEYETFERPITRAEIARMLVRLSNDVISAPKELYAPMIKDYEQTPAEMRPYILKAYAAGYMKGDPDGNFNAGDPATRAEAVAMGIRAQEKIKK